MIPCASFCCDLVLMLGVSVDSHSIIHFHYLVWRNGHGVQKNLAEAIESYGTTSQLLEDMFLNFQFHQNPAKFM